jgi:hypothetical protein
MRMIITAIALASLSSPALAAPCLTAREAQTLVIAALPDAIDAARTRCLPTLAATAPLIVAGTVTAARWRTEATPLATEAGVVIDKVSGFPISQTLGQKATRGAIKTMMTREITQRLSLDNCEATSEVVDSLSPLPARNVARVVIALMTLQSGKTPLPFTICKAMG